MALFFHHFGGEGNFNAWFNKTAANV